MRDLKGDSEKNKNKLYLDVRIHLIWDGSQREGLKGESSHFRLGKLELLEGEL
jgi:hypothetical protein